MTIVIPKANFRHAGDLPVRFGGADPRRADFSETEIIVDLRECQLIQPAAVLWCVIYLLLSERHGIACKLWIPLNMEVCVYLKSLGLFNILQEAGVEADDRDILDEANAQLVLPLIRFDNEYQVEQMINQAYDALQGSGLGASNLYPLISEVFGELAMNAVQHAESPVGAYGLIQFYERRNRKRFVCVVADGGVGIKRSLEKNPRLRDRVTYEWSAIDLAVRERISGTQDPVRGIGLYGVSEDMRKPGRELIIHSGIGSLSINEQVESRVTRVRLFPGTLTYVSIPT